MIRPESQEVDNLSPRSVISFGRIRAGNVVHHHADGAIVNRHKRLPFRIGQGFGEVGQGLRALFDALGERL
jgi:hypothetical protein